MSRWGLTRVLLVGVVIPIAITNARAQEIEFERFAPPAWTLSVRPGDYPLQVVQDRTGYLWSFTRTALLRFDGYDVRRYTHDPSDTTSIGPGQINRIFVDREGYLWIGYYQSESGVDRFDPETGRAEHVLRRGPGPQTLSRYDVVDFLEDSRGDIWFASWGGGLGRFHRKTGSLTFYEEKPDVSPRLAGAYLAENALLEDRQGDLWLRVAQFWDLPAEWCRLDRRRNRFDCFQLRSRAGNLLSVGPMTLDGTGRLLVGTEDRPEVGEDGLYVFDPSLRAFVPRATDSQLPAELGCDPSASTAPSQPCSITALFSDREGRLWVGRSTGQVTRYDPVTRQMARVDPDPTDPNGWNQEAVVDIWQSNDGLIWIQAGGRIYHTKAHAGLFQNIEFYAEGVRTITADRMGTLWAGGQIGFWLLNAPSGKPRLVPGIHSVFDIHENASGDLLVANWYIITHQGALYRLDRQSEHFELLTQWHDSTVVTTIEEDAHRNLWMGTRSSGLLRMDPSNGSILRYRHDPSDPAALAGNVVPALLLEGNGTLWVGSDGGLQRFDRASNTFELLTSTTGAVTSILRDREGWVWIGTQLGGLVAIDPDSRATRRFGVVDGLASNRVGGLLSDNYGYIWMATDEGISRLDPRTGAIRNFTEHDGIFSNTYLHTNATYTGRYRAPDGRLYFGGYGGVTVVNPDRMIDNPIPPQVVLQEVRLFDERLVPTESGPLRAPLRETERIVLRHDQNDVTFRYVGLHFAEPSQNTYAYRLEGLDKDWVEAGSERAARYADLRPGSYTFRVKAANSDGVWNEEGASIGIVVLPPWWATWWAFAAYAILLVGLLIAGHKSRTRRLKSRAEALEQQVAERTRELEQEKRTVEQQADRLADLEEAKDRFFANVSHEFRTPLTLILGPVDDLLSRSHTDLDADAVRKLQTVKRSGLRMKRLIDELLDLTRLEVGRLQLSLIRGEFVAFVREIVLSFIALAERKRISLHFHTGLERLEMAFDVDKMEKVVANLVLNALKYTPANGKVAVRISLANEDKPHVEVAVRDTGQGIPASELPRIFDRFYQASNARNSAESGAGIGLALTKELVDLHGGHIHVESDLGWGSVFTVRLPIDLQAETNVEEESGLDAAGEDVASAMHPGVAPREEVAIRPAAGEPEENEEPTHLDALVLIVEDNEDLRDYIRGHLEPRCHVAEAADGLQGLEMAQTMRPDLILTDIRMPRMDGLTLCREVKADPDLAHIPVVILTARVTEASKIEGFHAGADDYLFKPFSADELEARIENLIVIRRMLAERFGRAPVMEPSDVPLTEDAQLLEQVRDVVSSHLSDQHLTVEFLADEVAMSARTLQRRLQPIAQLSPSGYIRLMRMERAAQLLRVGVRSVSNVAHQVGYSDVAHFSRVFRETFGVLPSEYHEVEDA